MPWYDLRDVFDYIACIEFSLHRMGELPVGRAIGTVELIAAKHDSAALVFFAQAALDNLAVWFNNTYDLKLKGTGISFYSEKMKMQDSLRRIDPRYDAVLAGAYKFIRLLNEYRMAWLHRLAGGARAYCDPDDPLFIPRIMVPLDPKIHQLMNNHLQYFQRIEQVRLENNGEWLTPVFDFSNFIKEGVLGVVIDMLAIANENIVDGKRDY